MRGCLSARRAALLLVLAGFLTTGADASLASVIAQKVAAETALERQSQLRQPSYENAEDAAEDEGEEDWDDEEETGECFSTGDTMAIREAWHYLSSAANSPGRPVEVYTRHAVLVVPASTQEVASQLAGGGYSWLPRTIRESSYESAFTKFVLVGFVEARDGPAGISMGEEVCGEEGWSYVDQDAVNFLETTVKKTLSFRAPALLDCENPGSCVEQISAPADRQLPFLQAITNRSLEGNLLPVMLQQQALKLSVAAGDALGLLTASGGIWEAQRVLFVFAADLSRGLSRAQAEHCDSQTAKFMTDRGVVQLADYLASLEQNKTVASCGSAAQPHGWPMLITAARTASLLGLTRNRVSMSHAKQPNAGKADKVNGFGSFLFWNDQRTPGQRQGAQTTQVLPAAMQKDLLIQRQSSRRHGRQRRQRQQRRQLRRSGAAGRRHGM